MPLTGAIQAAVPLLQAVQAVLAPRIAFRLAIIIAGTLLAGDRRTASAWFVAAGVQEDWDRFYDCLINVGRTSEKLATVILGRVVQKHAPRFGERILRGMDDSPTSRYGRHVEGAGITIRREDEPRASGCTDTIGPVWHGWQGIRRGA